MHIVYERYDHDKGIMKSDSFSRLAQDRARIRIELDLNLRKTAKRNQQRLMLSEELTKLWQETTTASDFINAVEKKGYAIAAGTDRPYKVIDHTGTSFNLVRQLQGVNTREVRERFKATKLVREKQAIQAVRNRQAEERMNQTQEQAMEKIEQQKAKAAIKPPAFSVNDNKKAKTIANDNDKSKPDFSMSASFTANYPAIPGEVEDETRKQEKEKQARKLKIAQSFRQNEQGIHNSKTNFKTSFMNWNDIVEKQTKEYQEHLNGYHDSLTKLQTEKTNLMQHQKCKTESELPEPMRKILESNREAWQNEWGMYGTKFKAMRIAHQKEIDKHFRAQEITKDLGKDKGKDKDLER